MTQGPTGARLTLGTIAVSLATFMGVLDVSIANVAIPAIAGDLGASPKQGTWIITSYGVATAIALPLTGWLVKRIGTVRLFVASVAAFSLFSLLCGLAPTLEALVLLRVLQGAAAGPMIPLCQTLLLRSYPPERIGFALGMLAITTLIAPVAGPLLGGWLTDNASWRWVFHVNVPIGFLCAMVSWRIFRAQETSSGPTPFDTVGFALLVIWVGALQLGLDLYRDHDGFESPLIVGLGLTVAVFFPAFLIWTLTEAHPVIDLTLFRVRSFTVGTLTMSVAYAIFLGNLVLLPLWLQQYLGFTATLAGWVLAPIGLVGVLVTPLVGRALGRIDARWLVSGAFLVFALALWMRAAFTTDSDMAQLMQPSFIQGAGNALFFVPLLAIILGDISRERVASASGLNGFMRYVGGSIGVSLITTAWEWRASLHRARLVESISDGAVPLAEYRAALQAAGQNAQQQLATIERMVEQQAHTIAVNEVFMVSSLAITAAIGLLWCTGRPATRRRAPG